MPGRDAKTTRDAERRVRAGNLGPSGSIRIISPVAPRRATGATGMTSFAGRILSKVVTLREGEATTAFLMFAYSFLAMTAYNIVKPVTRSQFISDLGADNLPWVQLGAGLIIGAVMHVYGLVARRLPRRHVIPATLAGEAALLVAFWGLFRTGAPWVSAAFYVMGFLLAVLLISQFWTLANDIYDARQAKRLFGLIGGGASLGGLMGSGITAFAVGAVGTNNLLLVGAAVLGIAVVVVMGVMRRQPAATVSLPVEERGVGAKEAVRLLRSSRQLRLIAVIISLGALAAGILDQQLLLAVAADKGESDTAGITAFLAQVTLWVSLVGFVVQVGLTSRIHRSLGLAFAMLLLPLGLGATSAIVIVSGALWAVAGARILDSSLRYTIDKTTREVLYLPLSAELRQSAKPFIDVTADRAAKALSGLLTLVLIKPWGLNLTWQQLSYALLVVAAVWIAAALVARREYFLAFRRGLSTRAVSPAAVPLFAANPAAVEALVEELSSPDDTSVLYAIDMLDGLDKRHLITPLLVHHPSASVRARVLLIFGALRASASQHWVPAVERLLEDDDPAVRAASMRALASLKKYEAPSLVRNYLADPAPRVAVTAASLLASSDAESDRQLAVDTLERLASDTRADAAEARREVAAGLAQIPRRDLHGLLVSLIHDSDVSVAREAIRSARAIGAGVPIFVPALCSLLRHRLLKREAREALVGYGEEVVPTLAHLLHDPDEDPWVRRHVPATLAMVPTQASLDALVATLSDADGFLRFKVIEAIDTLRRARPSLTFDANAIEPLVLKECNRFCNYLTLRHNVVTVSAGDSQTLLARTLTDKLNRTLDRIYRLLGLIYPWKDIDDARFTLEHGSGRARSSALEYLEHLLRGPVRARVIPLIDDISIDDRVRHANLALKTRPRDLPDTLAQLIHDDDPVVSSAAIHLVVQRQLWTTLGDDIHHVLEHRSSDDTVADAAAWAVSTQQPQQSGDAVVFDPLPTVELVDRLRAIPLFEFVSIDELFRIARTGRQVTHDDGHEVYLRGAHVDAVQILLDGSVRMSGADGTHVLGAPAALGFEAAIEDRAIETDIHAVGPAICLRIDDHEFLAMLSDSTEMTQGLFRLLLERSTRRVAPRDHALVDVAGSRDRRRSIGPIERARLLQQHPIFGRASVDQLIALVAAATDVPLTAGRELFGDHERPSMFHILDGEIQLEYAGSAPFRLGAGSTTGVEETLAGTSAGCRGVVTTGGRALRLDRDVVFAVLADHSGLLQSLFSGVFSARNETGEPPAH